MAFEIAYRTEPVGWLEVTSVAYHPVYNLDDHGADTPAGAAIDFKEAILQGWTDFRAPKVLAGEYVKVRPVQDPEYPYDWI